MNTQDKGTEATVWTKERERALAEPLDMKLTAHRDAFDGGKRKLTYLEGHVIIAQLNRIFGYNGWSYSLDQHGVDEHTEGQPQEWYAQFWAVVTLEIGGVRRQDMGTSEIQNSTRRNNVRNADARSTGRKAAVTDALKRAARTFGSQFGNSLYDVDDDVYAWMTAHSLDEGEGAAPTVTHTVPAQPVAAAGPPAKAARTTQGAQAAASRPGGATVTAPVKPAAASPAVAAPARPRAADPAEPWPRSAGDWTGEQLAAAIRQHTGEALDSVEAWAALACQHDQAAPQRWRDMTPAWRLGLYQALRTAVYAETIPLAATEEDVVHVVAEALGDGNTRHITMEQYHRLREAGEARKAELASPLLAGGQGRAQVAS